MRRKVHWPSSKKLRMCPNTRCSSCGTWLAVTAASGTRSPRERTSCRPRCLSWSWSTGRSRPASAPRGSPTPTQDRRPSPNPMQYHRKRRQVQMGLLSSRRLFFGATAAFSSLFTSCKRSDSTEEEGPRRIGRPLRAYGERSEFEKSRRELPTTKILEVGQSYTPLAELYGIITPSALHYERHHSGVPTIDPAVHRLLIHDMVERPLIFTM